MLGRCVGQVTFRLCGEGRPGERGAGTAFVGGGERGYNT